MATVKPKMVGNFTITGDCISHARTDVEVRDVDTTDLKGTHLFRIVGQ